MVVVVVVVVGRVVCGIWNLDPSSSVLNKNVVTHL